MSEEAAGAPAGVEVMPREKAPARRRQAVAAYVPPDPANPTPAQMLMLAVSRGDSIQQLQQLMDLQDRWDAKQARRAFDAAIAAAKAEIKPILKDREVDFTGSSGKRTNYRHESLAAIARHVDPILAAHGLNCRHRPRQEDGQPVGTMYVTCILSHRDGHSEEITLHAPYDTSGNKNSAQAVASIGSYLQRYTLRLALGLAIAEDADDDGNAGGVELPRVGPGQVKTLEDEVKRLGADRAAFLRHINCEQFEDILACNFDTVLATLRLKKGMAGGKSGTAAPQRKSGHAHASPELDHAARIRALSARADLVGVAETELLDRYKVTELFHLTFEQIDDAEGWLGRIHAG